MSSYTIVRTMNVGMCNQLFTYALARYIKHNTGSEIILDYSHTCEADMKHNAGYASALGHFALDTNVCISDSNQYAEYGKSTAAKLERILDPVRYKMPWVRKRNRIRLRNEYIMSVEHNKSLSLAKSGILLNHDVGNMQYDEAVQALISGTKLDEVSVLSGYWQVPDYARGIKNILYRELVEDSGILDNIRSYSEKHSKLIDNMTSMNSVCIHIRRGDYVGDKMHEVCSKEYYLEGVKHVQEEAHNPVFYIFSDDIEYAKKVFEDVCGEFVYIDNGLKDYEELIMMSRCKYFIISNSSFSWWAQFLSDSQYVIAPSRWYGDPSKKSLLYEKHWKLIEV